MKRAPGWIEYSVSTLFCSCSRPLAARSHRAVLAKSASVIQGFGNFAFIHKADYANGLNDEELQRQTAVKPTAGQAVPIELRFMQSDVAGGHFLGADWAGGWNEAERGHGFRM